MTKTARFALLLAIVVDGFLWHEIVSGAPAARTELFFLNVGQGDAQLLVLPGGVTILTDAGPDRAVLSALETALPAGRRRVDLAILTHPQLDHFGGMNELLERYSFGMVLVNGRDAESGSSAQWEALREDLEEAEIPVAALRSGDTIRHGAAEIRILNPDQITVQSGELNDTAIVQLVLVENFSALLTADIGFAVEERITKMHDISADVLKVPHHGSKFSSGEAFLDAVAPQIAFIQSGRGNRYGHPAPEVLERLAKRDAEVLRTDTHGTLRVVGDGDILRVFGDR